MLMVETQERVSDLRQGESPWLKEELIVKVKRSNDTRNKRSMCCVGCVVWYLRECWPKVHWLFLKVAEIWEIAYH